jgi:hypothetical protein
VLTVTFLAAVWSLDTPASLAHTTAAGVIMAIIIGGTVCAVPFAALASLAYVLVALRARTPRR